MKELWKDIPGYEGRYKVSNTGKVKSFLKNKENGSVLVPEFARGYPSVGLCDGKRKKTVSIHRLVALAFVPNPHNYNEVNHKDENKQNNNADNLEWCSRAYNMSYKTARFRQGISASKKVEQLTLDDIPIALYYSVPVAAKINNIDGSSILKCCNGRRKYVGGYKWRYAESSDQ